MSDAFECLGEEFFDVVILDLYLPDSYGFETLTRMEAKKINTPIIVMTGLKDERIGIEALRHGANDYLVKGQITADLFLRTVNYSIERFHLEQMKNDMISYVNHELGNPLAVIKEGVSQVVDGLKGEINVNQKNLLNIVLNNVDRLEHITEQLLDSMRIDLGKLPLEKATVNLVALTQQVVASSKLVASHKGIEIKEKYSSEIINIRIDQERIEQVWINLLNNALKYIYEGSIEVSITEKKDFVECSVKDSGPGIAAVDTEKIFHKFVRLSQKKGGTVKGTGLGLFICKQLVELHGGSIWVESKINEGATFTFSLPKNVLVSLRENKNGT